MRVHASNFAIVGFTEQASLAELVGLGAERDLPVIDDIGSGAMEDFASYGLAGEPVAAESIKAGADIVLFSGDKLLGGPQSGIIVGKRALVEKISKHPLMRALRVDKITMAALVETLRLHQDRETAEHTLPLLTLLSTSPGNLRNRAERMAPQLAASPAIKSAEPTEMHTYLGGGSVPGQQIPTWCVALEPARDSVDALAATLRRGSPSVFGRIHKDRLLLDLRSVFPKQDMQIVDAVQGLNGGSSEADEPS
jgi:L-seryl-tRNA(Ser) seleniumtransferase